MPMDANAVVVGTVQRNDDDFYDQPDGNIESNFDDPQPASDDEDVRAVTGNLPTRLEGIVKQWHATEGRGQIEDDMTGDLYFCHWEELCPKRNPPRIGWKPTLQTGESVQFTPGTNPQPGPHFGKPMATNVTGAFSRPLLCDWIRIPYCEYRGDPRECDNDDYDPSLVRTKEWYDRNGDNSNGRGNCRGNNRGRRRNDGGNYGRRDDDFYDSADRQSAQYHNGETW